MKLNYCKTENNPHRLVVPQLLLTQRTPSPHVSIEKETFFVKNFIFFNFGKKYFCIKINIWGATVKKLLFILFFRWRQISWAIISFGIDPRIKIKENFFVENFILYNLDENCFWIKINIWGAMVKKLFFSTVFLVGANFLGGCLCWYWS